jgi:hypothetical protein
MYPNLNRGENIMLDLTKPIQTRNGREAKVYEVFKDYLLGAWKDEKVTGRWIPVSRDLNGEGHNYTVGRFDSGTNFINIPESFGIQGWVNVYSDGAMSKPYKIKGCAATKIGPDVIACIYVNRTIIKGEGL